MAEDVSWSRQGSESEDPSQLNEMNEDTYEKRTGIINRSGTMFEERVCALVFLTLVKSRAVTRFRLCTNLEGVGEFDDCVVRYSYKTEDGKEETKTLFIQVKFSESNTAQRLVTFLKARKPYIDIEKYFMTFCSCQKSIRPQHAILCGDASERHYIIYTNADVTRDIFYVRDEEKMDPLLSGIILHGEVLGINNEIACADVSEYKRYCDFMHALSDALDKNTCNTLEDVLENEIKLQNPYLARNIKDMKERIAKLINEHLKKCEQAGKGISKGSLSKIKICCPKNIKEQLDKYKEVDGTLFEDFQSKFKICCLQRDIEGLDACIKNNIREIMSLPLSETELAFKNFKEFMMKWRETGTEYLRNTSDILGSITREILYARFEMNVEKYSRLNVRFSFERMEHIRNITEGGHPGVFNIISEGTSTILTCLKVWQTLSNQSARDFLFLHVDDCKSTSTVLDVWRWCNALVIECTDTENTQQVFEKICEKFSKHNPKKKLILVSPQHSTWNLLFQNWHGVYRELKDKSTFQDFDEKSQKTITEKNINFQGKNITLKSLLGDEGIRQLSCDFLSKIISNETPRLGEDITNPETSNYISRTISIPCVSSEVFNVKDTNIVIALETSSESFEFLPGVNTFTVRDVEENYTRKSTSYKHQLSDSNFGKHGCKIILIKGRDKEFDKLCNIFDTVHWLYSDGKELIWKKSKGGTQNILPYVTYSKEVAEENFIQSPDRKSPVLITADSGMGKTTLLHNMAALIKNMLPWKFVVRVHLPRHSLYFSQVKGKKISEQHVMDIVAESLQLSAVECKNFVSASLKFERFVFLLDAFDEISPIYDKIVLEFVLYLSRNSYSVYITSCKNVKYFLENKLSVLSTELQPLNFESQKKCLYDFWKERNNSIEKELLESLSEEILETCSQSLQDFDTTFMGNALQIKMLAEIYDNKWQANTLPKLNIIDLFREFVNKKCCRYFVEKRDADLSNSDTQIAFQKFIKDFVEWNKNVSALQIFGANILDNVTRSKSKNNIVEFLEKNPMIEKVGIVRNASEKSVIYNHRLFAEYFAALWLFDNYFPQNKVLKEKIYQEEMETVRKFLDSKISENSLFHAAVLLGDFAQINKLLDSGHDVNGVDKMDRTALHLAASYNNLQVSELLIKKSADFNKRDKLDWTPLTYAVESHSWNVVNLFIKKEFHGNEEELWNALKVHVNEAIFFSCVKSLTYLLAFICSRIDLNLQFILSDKMKRFVSKDNRIGTNEQILITSDVVYIAVHIATSYNQIDAIEVLHHQHCDIHVKNKNGYTALHVAARNGYKEIVQFLVENGHDVNCHSTDFKQLTPLHVACQRGHSDTVKQLVEYGANFDARNKNGDTVLMLASENGHTGIVNYLLEKNTEINYINKYGDNAVLMAAKNGHAEIVELLKNKGGDIHHVNDYGYSPLLVAAAYGHNEVVEFCIKEGADVKQVRKYGNDNAALIAFKRKHYEIVEYCIENGNGDIDHKNDNEDSLLLLASDQGAYKIAKICLEKRADVNARNKYGDTPVLLASKKGYLDIVEGCLDKGADVNHLNIYDYSALLCASRNGHLRIVQLCIEHGANVNYNRKNKESAAIVSLENDHEDIAIFCVNNGADMTLVNRNGDSVFTLAAMKGCLDVVETCVQHDINIDQCNRHGNTALAIAAEHCHVGIAEYCVETGADVNHSNNSGDTALILAARTGCLQIVQLLSDKGANINYINKRNEVSALLAASASGHKELVEYLLEKEADINHRDESQNSALILAVTGGYKDIAEVCIKRKAEVNFVNKYGHTALLLACQMEYNDIVKMCVENKADVNYVRTVNKDSALHAAYENHNIHIVRYLIEIGKANVNIKNRRGNTLFLESAIRGHLDIVKLSVEHGAFIDQENQQGDTALLLACRNGHFEIMKYCIGQGSNIEHVNNNGDTALTLAIKRGHFLIVKSCLDKGANVNHVMERRENNSVTLALNRRYFGIAIYCLEHGANVNHQNIDGDSALLLAAKTGNADIVKYCLENGADKDHVNKFDYNALLLASENGHKSIVELCIAHEISKNHVKKHSEENAVLVALKYNHLAIAVYCLEKGVDVNKANIDGDTALLIASRKGSIDIVRQCVELGADINHANKTDDTALLIASKQRHFKIVKYLRKKGADINKKNIYGYTSAVIASIYNDIKITKYCIKNGANINYVRERNSRGVLLEAAENGQFKIVKKSVKLGASISQADSHKETALFLACSRGYFNIVQYLIEADDFRETNLNRANISGYTPLLIAAENGFLEIVKYCISKGANVNCFNHDKDNAMLLALKNSHLDIAIHCVMRGGDVNHFNTDGENSFLLAARKGQMKAVKCCLEHGANINSTDNDGNSALLLAARKGFTDIAKYLIDSGSDVNHTNSYGYNALILSAKLGYQDILEYCLNRGANINYKKPGSWETALLVAYENKQFKIVDYCMDNEADVNNENKNGENLLHLCARQGNSEIAKKCIEKIRNVNHMNARGETALLLAATYGHYDIVKMCVEKGAEMNHIRQAASLADKNRHRIIAGYLLRHAS